VRGVEGGEGEEEGRDDGDAHRADAHHAPGAGAVAPRLGDGEGGARDGGRRGGAARGALLGGATRRGRGVRRGLVARDREGALGGAGAEQQEERGGPHRTRTVARAHTKRPSTSRSVTARVTSWGVAGGTQPKDPSGSTALRGSSERHADSPSVGALALTR
jgi:hypothetical protein